MFIITKRFVNLILTFNSYEVNPLLINLKHYCNIITVLPGLAPCNYSMTTPFLRIILA